MLGVSLVTCRGKGGALEGCKEGIQDLSEVVVGQQGMNRMGHSYPGSKVRLHMFRKIDLLMSPSSPFLCSTSLAASSLSLVPLLCCPLNLGEQRGLLSSLSGWLSIGDLGLGVFDTIFCILTILTLMSPGWPLPHSYPPFNIYSRHFHLDLSKAQLLIFILLPSTYSSSLF